MKVSTKQNKNAKAVDTQLTIIWDDAQTERALAQSATIVRMQSHWRKHSIPPAVTIKMSELRAGLRGEYDPIAAAKDMTPEQRAALIAQLQAMK